MGMAMRAAVRMRMRVPAICQRMPPAAPASEDSVVRNGMLMAVWPRVRMTLAMAMTAVRMMAAEMKPREAVRMEESFLMWPPC